MIEFGKTLRAAREAKGLSVAKIAEATNMPSRVIESLESEDFSAISAPIYGRGFVRLYCEQVGLDSKVMIAEFMEIYNGAKDLGIREKPISSMPPVSDPPLPPPATEEPIDAEPIIAQTPSLEEETNVFSEPPPITSPAPQPDLFSASPYSSYSATRSAPVQAKPVEPSPIVSDEPKRYAPEASSRYSRYASPVSNRYEPPAGFKLPDIAFWRIGILAGCAIAILIVAFLGIRALYRATTEEEAPISETTAQALNNSEVANENKTQCQGAADNATRAKVAIPPLYLTD